MKPKYRIRFMARTGSWVVQVKHRFMWEPVYTNIAQNISESVSIRSFNSYDQARDFTNDVGLSCAYQGESDGLLTSMFKAMTNAWSRPLPAPVYHLTVHSSQIESISSNTEAQPATQPT